MPKNSGLSDSVHIAKQELYEQLEEKVHYAPTFFDYGIAHVNCHMCYRHPEFSEEAKQQAVSDYLKKNNSLEINELGKRFIPKGKFLWIGYSEDGVQKSALPNEWCTFQTAHVCYNESKADRKWIEYNQGMQQHEAPNPSPGMKL